MSTNPTLMHIRPALDPEMEIAMAVAERAFFPMKEYIVECEWYNLISRTRKNMSNTIENTVLVALCEDTLVGTVVYNGPPGPRNTFPEGWSYMRGLAVEPGWNRQGVGRALVLECVNLARRHAARHIGLYTADDNVGARNLYMNLGFDVHGDPMIKYGLPYKTYCLTL